MSDEQRLRAVVDRIVDDRAVVLVGEDEEEVELAVGELPAGVEEGTWLRVRRDCGELEILGIDEEGGETARTEAEDRMARLREERGGGRFDR